MRMIFDQWADDQVEFTATDAWFARLLENPNEDIYLRYVGMTNGTAMERHTQEVHGQAGGLLGMFYNTLRRVDPATFNNVNIYYFYRTTATEMSQYTQRMRDMKEQIIIAFFGVENLLNTQYGGRLSSYQPSSHQTGRLERFRSRFFSLFQQHATPQQDQHVLQPWIERVMDGALHSMEHDLLDMMLDQALPHTVDGYTILVLLGADITIADFDNAQSFLGGASRAGDLTRNILTRLGRLDIEAYHFTPHPFPFVNLYPWPNTVDTRDDAIEQLQTYMTLVQPIVTVSFSSSVTSVAFADFLHHNGLTLQTGNRYLQYVGIPRLVAMLDQQWVDNDGSDATRQQRLTILIPHVDPGYERYGERSIELLRLLDLQLAIATIISELAITCIIDHPEFTRNQVVQHVWHVIENNECERIVAALLELDELKTAINQRQEQLLAQQPPAVRRIEAAVAQWRALGNIQHHGIAEGAPHSPQRHRQLTRLWRLNKPALHIHIGRDAMEDWLNWGLQLVEGASFFASAMRHVGMRRHHPLHNALQQVAPPNADPDGERLNDPEALVAAVQRWGALMRDVYVPHDYYSSENQRQRVAIRWKMADNELDYTEVQEGRSIYIPQISAATLRWQDGQEQRDLRLTFPKRLLQASDERQDCMRALRFLPNGIGLDDNTGQPVMYQGSTTIITLTQLKGFPDRFHLMRLWIQERVRLGDQSALDHTVRSYEHIPPFQRRPPLTVTHGENIKREFLQGLYQGDALALFGDFLDEEFPNGGRVNLAKPENQGFFQDTIPLQQRFATFLDKHHDHPHHDTWEKWNSDITRNGKQYWPNIQLLRPGSQSLPPEKRNIRGVGVRQCKIIDIAPIPHQTIPRLDD
ncbi:hypothetical protein O0I10_006225 [Lichtheimia ornata]|uniref:Uncharacterized protein n=1 Tax=Lichtheimia ornata TaxID=688661 RepID=A0AAD7V4Y2_9FUNG|nr:uncharacterized protein O0I10_006225 [Lichtheimia ornata]KAJ8658217.1 hypothetical protein O0I10_006225 [Lichtheimia ornata]